MISNFNNNTLSSPAPAPGAHVRNDSQDVFSKQLSATQQSQATDAGAVDSLMGSRLIAQRGTRPVVGPDLPTDERGIVEGGPMAAIRYGLEQAQGFMIGDIHGDTYITQFLANNMAQFRDEGVSVFFIEMIRSADQEVLDRFMESGDPSELIAYLQPGWDKGPGWIDSVIDVIEAARQQGMQVVGIDIPYSGNDRLETSNPHWTQVIQNQMSVSAADEKYLIFGGGAHAGDFPANTGVDARLGIMSGSYQTTHSASDPDRKVPAGEAQVNPNPNGSSFIFGRPTE